MRFALQQTHKRGVPKISPSSLRLTAVFKKMIALLMLERYFNDRTAYFEQLVRDDWDERATPQMEAELTAFLVQEKAAEKVKPKPATPSPGGSHKTKPTRNSRSKRVKEPASS